MSGLGAELLSPTFLQESAVYGCPCSPHLDAGVQGTQLGHNPGSLCSSSSKGASFRVLGKGVLSRTRGAGIQGAPDICVDVALHGGGALESRGVSSVGRAGIWGG